MTWGPRTIYPSGVHKVFGLKFQRISPEGQSLQLTKHHEYENKYEDSRLKYIYTVNSMNSVLFSITNNI